MSEIGSRAKQTHQPSPWIGDYGQFSILPMTGKMNFKEGKKHGVFSYYYDDGTLLRTENWNMDVKSGEFKTFYYDQTIQEIESFKKGLILSFKILEKSQNLKSIKNNL